jgi:hypothetical protein
MLALSTSDPATQQEMQSLADKIDNLMTHIDLSHLLNVE